jgi:hypothetical protein
VGIVVSAEVLSVHSACSFLLLRAYGSCAVTPDPSNA